MTKRKRKSNNGDSSSPRRSRRLNNLLEDGSPVRRSTRLANNSVPGNNSRRDIAVSITQSARIPSRSKSKNKRKSRFDLVYHRKKTKRVQFISQSQTSNDGSISEEEQIPIALDTDFQGETLCDIEQNDYIESNKKTIRVCHCDQLPLPIDCDECKRK